jgi:Tfp pilus assembly protein PilX
MRRLRRTSPEAGFTMVTTLVGTAVMAAMALVAVTAVRNDIPAYSNDLASKRAYEAARAGVEDYAFRLYNDPTYWTKCTSATGNTSLNQKGSTTNRRKVPGDSKAEYAIELIPATGQTECKTSAATESMIETSGSGIGSFRIRSNGFDNGKTAQVVATFKRPSFLDYVYFTQLETSDPVTYGYANPSTQLTGAYSQCELTYEQGRYNNDIPGTDDNCNVISFVTGDEINGPLHTNDTMATCGSPVFGREASDVIETGGKSPGYWKSCSGTPTFKGTRINSAAILVPPETNSKLKSLAQPSFRYSGQVRICLSGGNMTVGTGSSCTGKYSGSIPSNGVIYVENSTTSSCSTDYSPFTATYPSTSGCGNVYIQGTYTGQLTVAAENDVIIRDDICRGNCETPTGSGMLGLIANNFVRVYHPRPNASLSGCGSSEGEERLTNLDIDAALLAIKHSFIVDHYNCGSSMGDLKVEGAIAQKFRGPVGTSGGNTGYIKDYRYDDRLRYLEPPYFIEPTGTAWVIGRITTD